MRMIPFTIDANQPREIGVCFCCRRSSYGIGSFHGQRIIWSCPDHVPLLRKAISIMPQQWDFLESQSLIHAGIMAGRYLESIGKTDLAALTRQEYFDFGQTLLDSFAKELERRLNSHEPPF